MKYPFSRYELQQWYWGHMDRLFRQLQDPRAVLLYHYLFVAITIYLLCLGMLMRPERYDQRSPEVFRAHLNSLAPDSKELPAQVKVMKSEYERDHQRILDMQGKQKLVYYSLAWPSLYLMLFSFQALRKLERTDGTGA